MQPSTKWKIAGVVGAVALVIALLLIIKYQRDIITQQSEIQKSLVETKKLPGNVVRSEARYVTPEDLEKTAKELGLKLEPINKDLKELGADVKAIQTVKVITVGSNASNLPSDSTKPRTDNPTTPVSPESDPHGYSKNTQTLKLNEPFEDKQVPWGEASFSAWREKPWDLEVYPRKYSVVNVLGQDDDGRHYTYSRFSVEVDGKRHDVAIQDSKLVEEYPSSKFRFSPNLYAGIGFGSTLTDPKFEAVPNLQLSFFSVGKTKYLPEWTILNLGVGYEITNENFGLVLTPFSYNVGEPLPLLKNLYVGPVVGLDTDGSFALLLGVSVGL